MDPPLRTDPLLPQHCGLLVLKGHVPEMWSHLNAACTARVSRAAWQREPWGSATLCPASPVAPEHLCQTPPRSLASAEPPPPPAWAASSGPKMPLPASLAPRGCAALARDGPANMAPLCSIPLQSSTRKKVTPAALGAPAPPPRPLALPLGHPGAQQPMPSSSALIHPHPR